MHPQDCSWYWKKTCSVRDKFKVGLRENGWLKPNGVYTVASGYKWKMGEEGHGIQGTYPNTAILYLICTLTTDDHGENGKLESVGTDTTCMQSMWRKHWDGWE